MTSRRDAQRRAATHVLELFARGHYTVDGQKVTVASHQQAAVAGSHLYTPAALTTLRAAQRPAERRPAVEVVDATTQQAAHELSGNVWVLNFASARNPGGGFLNGATAQEEDLCRCSGLYPTLIEHPAYYEANRRAPTPLYTDHMIVSPSVPFIRVRSSGDLLAQPFTATVVTAPAPNTGAILGRHAAAVAELPETFERRWRNVLAVAEAGGASTLVLGAWGCGAFRGDPAMISDAAVRALKGARVPSVVFAIPGFNRQSARNLAMFRERLQTRNES